MPPDESWTRRSPRTARRDGRAASPSSSSRATRRRSAAIEQLNGRDLKGRPLRVNEAENRPPAPAGRARLLEAGARRRGGFSRARGAAASRAPGGVAVASPAPGAGAATAGAATARRRRPASFPAPEETVDEARVGASARSPRRSRSGRRARGAGATTSSRTTTSTERRPRVRGERRATGRTHARARRSGACRTGPATTATPSTSILDEGLVCHVGFVDDGQPFVVPSAYARRGDRLVIHGSAASRMVRALAGGAPACVTVTLLDGLVLARSGFHHSMNYRSVVVLGAGDRDHRPGGEAAGPRRDRRARRPGARRERAPAVGGRAARHPRGRRCRSTRRRPRCAPARRRTTRPTTRSPVWAGELPLRLEPLAPVADPRLAPGIAPPPDVTGWRRPGRPRR